MNATNIRLGVIGGLIGGAVFGVMMAKMGMLPMVGQLIGQPSVGAGFLVHMVNSVTLGVAFALLLGPLATGIGRGLLQGLLYGGAWWLLGPLTLMPLFLGMGLGVNWNLTAASNMLPSLMGHLVYGALLGITYGWLRGRTVPAASTASSA